MAAVIIASYCGWNFTYIHGIIVVTQSITVYYKRQKKSCFQVIQN